MFLNQGVETDLQKSISYQVSHSW